MTEFALARREDDALLRSILSTQGMPGWVEMAVEREPSFFAGSAQLGAEWAVIAREAGQPLAMYTVAVRELHVGGRPQRIAYLGGLRILPEYRHRIRLLRDGYASIVPLCPDPVAPSGWFTVIGSGNAPARRLLEAGLPGLPAYVPIGDYVSHALTHRWRRRRGLWTRCADTDTDTIIGFHNEQAARFDLSPVLDAAAVRRVGAGNFFLYRRRGAVAGVAAFWDQRAFRQVVARAYRRPLAGLIPLYNLYATLRRRIRLPRAGCALEQSFIAFLQIADEAVDHARALLQDLLGFCATPVASLGLAPQHPLAAAVASLQPVRYPARVYSVALTDVNPAFDRCLQPEAALL